MGGKQRMAGASLSLTLLILNAIISLFYVPILLRFLTVSEYGIFELGTAVIAYLAMMDFGLSAALSRFYVLRASSDPKRLPSLITTSFVIYMGITVLAMFLTTALIFSFDSLFGGSFTEQELEMTSKVLVLVLVNCLFAIPAAWVNGLITAGERFVFLRGISIARSLVQFTLVTLILYVSSNVVFALGVQVAISAAVLFTSLWYARHYAGLSLKFGRWSSTEALVLFRFSSLLAVIVAFDLVFWRTGQFIMGAVSGTAAIASYALVSRLITSIFMPISTSISSVFLPHLTKLVTSPEGRSSVNDLFIRVGRLQAVLVWSAIAGFALLGKDLITLWVGDEFGDVYISALILMLGLSISSIQSLGNSILQATNQLGFKAILFTVMLLVFLALSVPVASRHGVPGLATLGAILLLLGTGPVLNLYYRHRIGLDTRRFFIATVPVLVPVALASGIVYAVTHVAGGEPTWLSLGLSSGLFGTAVTIFVWLLFLNKNEKTLIKKILRQKKG